MKHRRRRCHVALCRGVVAAWFGAATVWALAFAAAPMSAHAAELWIGAASADITPDRPVPLTGGTSVRIGREIQSRLAANVLALESRDGQEALDQAILVSCDLCVIRPGIQEGLRKHLAGRLPGFDLNKLFLAATHTHTAPVLLQGRYDVKDYADAVQPKEYVPWMYEQMGRAVVEAWESRGPGAVAWGLGHAVAGHNRRVVYSDGTAKMHGNTGDPEFRGIEGYEDHAVHVLCFYDSQKRLKAAAITLATTAQSMGGSRVSADFWHAGSPIDPPAPWRGRVRTGILRSGGRPDPQAAGAPQERTTNVRASRPDVWPGNRPPNRQHLRRPPIGGTWKCPTEWAGVIAKDIRTDVPLVHRVQQIELPARIVTDDEYAVAESVCEAIDAKKARTKSDYWTRNLYQFIAERYLAQQKGEWKTFEMELHVLRLGDVAIATNPFELFLDYGVQIEARSPAVQTFLIQLATNARHHGYYLPTPRAMAGGALDDKPFTNYSATAMSNTVGPEGGQVLVDRTVEAIEELWK